MELTIMERETGRMFKKIIPSYYLAQKFMAKVKRSKKIIIVAYEKLG